MTKHPHLSLPPLFQRAAQLAAFTGLFLLSPITLADVELNRATEAQLDGLRGIGPPTTRAILAERERGEFADWADFTHRVKGFGPKRAANLSADGLRINGQPWPQSQDAQKTPNSSKALN